MRITVTHRREFSRGTEEIVKLEKPRTIAVLISVLLQISPELRKFVSGINRWSEWVLQTGVQTGYLCAAHRLHV